MVLLHGTLDVTIHEATDLPLTMSNKVSTVYRPTGANSGSLPARVFHGRYIVLVESVSEVLTLSVSGATAASQEKICQCRDVVSALVGSRNVSSCCSSLSNKRPGAHCNGMFLIAVWCDMPQAAGIMKRIVCCNAGPTLVGSCDPYVCLGE